MLKYDKSESYVNDEEGLNKVNSEMGNEYCGSNSNTNRVDEGSEREKESYVNDEEGLNKVNSETGNEYCGSNSNTNRVDEGSEREKESYVNDEEELNMVNSETGNEYCGSNSNTSRVDEDSEREKEVKYSKHELLIIEAIIKLCKNVKLFRKICTEVDIMIKAYNPNGELNCFEGKDYVNEIFDEWSSGKRKWNIEKHPDICKQIRLVARSKIINDVKKKSNLPKERYIYEDCNDIPEVNKLADYGGEEYEENESKRLNKVISKMSEDNQLFYMECMKGKSQKEIAEYFKIPVSEVKNWHKRFLRELKKHKNYIKQSD